MKKRIVGAMFIFAVMLSACSNGVTQSEYDQCVLEKESLQKEYDALQEKYDVLQKSYTEFKEEYSDLLDEKTENMLEKLPNQYAQAWVDTAFSGKGICSIKDDMLFASILTEKNSTEEDVKELRSELLSAIKVYAYMKATASDSFPWKLLSVTFYDASGAGMFQFTVSTEEDATIKSILIDAAHLDSFVKWLQ